MTKAADPVAGPRPFEGSRPACLDRIPGWERTRLAVASGDSADSVDVRLSGVVLRALGKAGARLNRRRPMAEPRHANTRGSARGRHLTDICGAGGGQDTEGRASRQRRSRNPGARSRDRNEGLVAIHSAHPLPSRCRQLTEEHRRSLRTLVGQGNFFFWATSVTGPRGPACRAQEAPPARVMVRTRPSCTTDTTSSPSSVKTWPQASPRAPAAVGDSWSYRSQRSARNGR